jgi:hypothetical protein
VARAVRGRPVPDGLALALAAALIVWYRLRLALPGRWGGYPLLARRLAARTSPAGARDEGAAGRLAGLLRRAAAGTPVSTACLTRSLALARLLRLHGLAAEIRIGLRRAEGRLAGHAWVEHNGALVGDDAWFVGRFTPLTLARQEGARDAR